MALRTPLTRQQRARTSLQHHERERRETRDLHLELSSKFELIFNLAAAKEIGLEIPSILMALADIQSSEGDQ